MTAPISVVIPSFNARAYLAQAIRSALAQTRPPAEVIVVDDGSQDDSARIAQGFGAPVRLVAGPHAGAAAARLQGVEAARGDRLLFLDADDILTPETLAGLAGALDDHDAGLALCPWDRYELDGAAWLSRPPSNALPPPFSDPLSAWLCGAWSPPCAVLWSREGYRRSGGWTPGLTMNQDGDLIMRALARGVRCAEAARGLALYRRLPGEAVSLSGRRDTAEGLAARIGVLERLVDDLQVSGGVAGRRAPLVAAARAIRARPEAGRAVEARCEAVIRRAGGARPTDRATAHAGASAARALAGARDRLRARRLVGPGTARRNSEAAPPPDRAPVRRAVAGDPVVSVVIPTHDRAALVRRAVESVRAQTYAALDIIVVDDASRDDTVARLGDLGEPRLRIIVQPRNRGVAASRNRGIAEARGRFVAFLDSDDLWRPEKIRAQVEALAGAPAYVGFCHVGSETVAPDGLVRAAAPEMQGDVFEALLLRNIAHGGGSTTMFRREALEAVGGFDETLPAVEDWDLFQRVARLYHLVAVDPVLARIHEDAPGPRRSLRFRANMTARETLFRRNRHALRRAGVEHLYLLESARRELSAPEGDAAAGRRLVLRALGAAPASFATWPWVGYMLAPASLRAGLRRIDPRRERLMRAGGPERCETRLLNGGRGSPTL